MDTRGAYAADRAAALSGVPVSTVHYWARKGILVPRLANERPKLWSYSDLLALRTIYWLRHEKEAQDGAAVPPASMPAVRRALRMLQKLNLDLFSANGQSRVVVDRAGEIIVRSQGGLARPASGQGVLDVLDVLAPFPTAPGVRGPDLRQPRPHLRIVPGKVSGEPHVSGTRLETQALAALAQRGVTVEDILKLYPFVSREAVEEALELEDQLLRNVQAAA
jgi:uncharacterized protein (DUF433 family)